MSTQFQDEVATVEKVRQDFQRPSKYNVIFHNDDYTPMEFVILVLQSFFKKTIEEATQITMQVHEDGSSIVAQYAKEIAKTKMLQVQEAAKQAGHPLKCTIEEVPENNRSFKP